MRGRRTLRREPNRWTVKRIGAMVMTLLAIVAIGVSMGDELASAASFHPQKIPKAIVQLIGVSCTGGHHCWAVRDNNIASNSGAVVMSANGGKSWTEQNVPSGIVQLVSRHMCKQEVLLVCGQKYGREASDSGDD